MAGQVAADQLSPCGGVGHYMGRVAIVGDERKPTLACYAQPASAGLVVQASDDIRVRWPRRGRPTGSFMVFVAVGRNEQGPVGVRVYGKVGNTHRIKAWPA